MVIFATLLQIHKFTTMKTILHVLVILLGLSLAGCAGEDKNNTLKQANGIHLESVAIAEDLEKNLLSLRQKQQDSLSLSNIDSIQKLIRLWEEALVEVPGFQHQHGHAGHHDHKPVPQMTDQSMLDYQISAREAIISVRKQVEILEKSYKKK